VSATLLLLAVVVAACGTPSNSGQPPESVSASPAQTGEATRTTADSPANPEPDSRDEGSADPAADVDVTDEAEVTGEAALAPTSAEAVTSAKTSAVAAGSPGAFTVAFAGDVNFAERTADRLAKDPTSAFGVAAPGLAAADLTVVNLETAITTGGEAEPKSFTFRAPPSAFTALRAAGVDVASMANNHGADFGEVGLQDSVAAIRDSGFPVIGIGADDTQAMTPFRTTINGVDVAIFAVSAVHDRTMQAWTATSTSPGIASAFDPRLVEHVRAEVGKGSTVIVFLHWGTEYDPCPDSDQEQLASTLAQAGATAVIGAHAHVLQGAGWRDDGVYVAYGLSNYLWWRSFGNEQDDNGVLTLTFDNKRVAAASFAPSHLDDTGVPVPATGPELDRIDAEWEQVRECADLADQPPS
jgi:poly-gamma-glutamate synthesis protein (capsule biosynthesis protein)